MLPNEKATRSDSYHRNAYLNEAIHTWPCPFLKPAACEDRRLRNCATLPSKDIRIAHLIFPSVNRNGTTTVPRRMRGPETPRKSVNRVLLHETFPGPGYCFESVCLCSTRSCILSCPSHTKALTTATTSLKALRSGRPPLTIAPNLSCPAAREFQRSHCIRTGPSAPTLKNNAMFATERDLL